MQIHKLKVDGQTFILEPGHDLAKLEAQILAAARAGAGFVQFKTVGRASVSVLITPHVGVRFEVLERDQEQLAEWELNPPDIDERVIDYDLI